MDKKTKVIVCLSAMILNVSLVVTLLWTLDSHYREYAFAIPVVLAIASVIMWVASADKGNKDLAKSALLGALLSFPMIVVVCFVILIGSGGMC